MGGLKKGLLWVAIVVLLVGGSDAALVLQPLVFSAVTTTAGTPGKITLQLFNGGSDATLVSASLTGPQATASFPAVRGGPVIGGFVNVSFSLTVAGEYSLSAVVYTGGQTVSLTNGINPAVIVTPGEGSAAQSRVLGLEPGRQLAVGRDANFSVLSADKFGNVIQAAETLSLTVIITALDPNQVSRPDEFSRSGLLFQPNSSQTLPATITPSANLSLVAFRTSSTVGSVTISVTLSGAPLPGSPFLLSAAPNPPSPAKSTLSGAGLLGAVAGVPAEVILTARDEFGNPTGLGGDLVTAILTTAGNGTAASLAPGFGSGASVSDMVTSAGGVASGPNVQPGVAVTDNADGTYSIKYTTAGPGSYSLSVSMNGLPLGGPVAVDAVTASGPFSADRSFVRGLKATMSGQNGSFHIVAVNSNGRQLTDVTLPSAGFDVSFSLRGRALLTTKAVTAGNGGLFTVPYTLTVAGVYAVSVSTGGLALPNPVEGTVGSALQLTVWPGPPSEVTSLVTSVRSEYRAGEQVAVFVDARDVSNNSQVYRTPGFSNTANRFTIAASPVVGCSSESTSASAPFPVRFDASSNLFSAQFQLPFAGRYSLQGYLNGIPFASGSVPVVSVSAGDIIPEKTVVYGIGSTLTAGLPAALGVELMDRWGNRDVPEGTNCSVVVRNATGGVAVSTCSRSLGCGLPFCQRNSAGCHLSANVTVSQAGPVVLDVLVNAVSVLGGGRAISVLTGPPAARFSHISSSLGASSQTIAGSNIDFTVTLRDAYNNSVTPSSALPDVVLETSLSSGGYTVVERIDALDSGSVFGGVLGFSHQPTKVGNLSLRLLIGGEEVPGSTQVVSILPGPTSASKSDTSGIGVHTATAGVFTSFTLQLRDWFGNLQTGSEDSVNASFVPVSGVMTASFSPVESLGSSAYRIGYIAYKPEIQGGSRLLNVTVTSANGTAEPVYGSPFLVTVSRGPAVANMSRVLVLNPVSSPLVVITGQTLELSVKLRDALGNLGIGQGVRGEPRLIFSAKPLSVNQTPVQTLPSPSQSTNQTLPFQTQLTVQTPPSKDLVSSLANPLLDNQSRGETLGLRDPVAFLTDFGNGTITARFVSYRVGEYRLAVELGGVEIGSGGGLVVTVAEGGVALDQTAVYGAAEGRPLIAGTKPQVALIQTRDAFGNPVSDNNGSSVAALQAAFALTLVPKTLPIRQIPVPSDVRFDASSGNYTATFSVPTAGVLLSSVNGTGLARQLVLPGPVDSEKTRLWGAGLARVLVGGTGRFSLLGLDAFDNPTVINSSSVSIAFTDATTDASLSTVSLNGPPVASADHTSLSFTYTVAPSFQPGQQFKITARLSNRLVAGSPSTVTLVDPVKVGAPVAELSLAEGPGLSPGVVGESTWFDVTLLDQDGTPLPRGNGSDAVSFSMTKKGAVSITNRVCPGQANGTYLCSFIRGENGTGDYDLDVRLQGGGQITGPGGGGLVMGAFSGPSVAELSSIEANATSIEAGNAVLISVGPHDGFGNPQDLMLQDLDELTVSVTGPRKAVTSVETVLGQQPSGLPSVSFQVTIRATMAGLYTLRGSPKSGGLMSGVNAFSWNVTAGPADVTQTSVLGAGLASAYVGEEAEVLIIAQDAYANRAQESTNVSLSSSPQAAATSIAYDSSRKLWVGRFVPAATGVSSLRVEVDGQAVTLTGYNGTWVQAGSVSANQSTAFGPGVGKDESGAALSPLLFSSVAQFTVLARDALGNPVRRGGALYDVTIRSADGSTERAGTVADNGDGSYGVSYKAPPFVGLFSGGVSRGGEQISGSPFLVSVTGGSVSFNSSVVRFPGRYIGDEVMMLPARARAGALLGLTVQLVDGSGQNTTETGNGTAIQYTVAGSDGGPVASAQMADLGGGSYGANFTLSKTGPFEVKLARNNEQMTFGGFASSGPADVARSSVIGPSALMVTAGKSVLVEILAVDANGNLVDYDTSSVFTAIISGGSASPIPQNATFAGNGRFVLALRPIISGQFPVVVQLSGQQISNGRLELQVASGEADAGTSSLDWGGKPYLVAGQTQQLNLLFKDAHGNVAFGDGLSPSLSILHYNVTTQQKTLVPVPSPSITPSANGSGYTVIFVPPTVGGLRVSLPIPGTGQLSDVRTQLADVSTGKPYELTVQADYFNANQREVYGPAVDAGAIAGQVSYFFIRLKDVQGNTVNTFQLPALTATVTAVGGLTTANATARPFPGGVVRVDFTAPPLSGNASNLSLTAAVTSDEKMLTYSPVSVTVWPSTGSVNASTSVAIDISGQQISGFTLGQPVGLGPTRLFIVGRDAQSRDVPHSGDPFVVDCLVATLGATDSLIKTVGNETGRTTVIVDVNVRRAGRYGVSYAVNGGPVMSFTLAIPPGQLDPSRTLLVAPDSGTAGIPLSYRVQLYDGSGNLRNSTVDGPDPLTVQLVQTPQPGMRQAFVDVPVAAPDGSYQGFVRSELAGKFLIRVTSSNVTLTQQNVTFTSGPLDPDRLAVANVSTVVTAGVLSTFPILASDTFGNPYQRPDLGFTTTVSKRGTIIATFPSILPRGSGFYLGQFAVTVAGVYNLSVTDDTTGFVVPGSLTMVSVTPGPAAARSSYVTGPSFGVVGKQVTLTLIARDQFGNPANADVSGFNFTVTGPQGVLVGGLTFGGAFGEEDPPPQVEDTLLVGFMPPSSGNFTLSVTINSTDVVGSPFSVIINPKSPVQVADVSIGASGSSLVVQFDGETQQGEAVSAPGGSCASLFGPPGMERLGLGAACYWEGCSALRVLPGLSAPVTRGLANSSSLTLLPGAIRGADTASVSELCPLQIPQSVNQPALTPALTAPGSVGTCHGFTLDASSTRGVLNRALSFAFGVQSLQDTQAVVALLAGHDSSQPVVYIPAGTLVPGASYEFTVTVTDSVGGYGRASVTTRASSAPIPLVSISAPPGRKGFRQLRATAGQAVVIDSTVSLPDLPCFETAFVNPPSLTLTWTQTSGPEINSTALAAQKTRSLSLPGGILTAGQRYGFELTAEVPGLLELTVSDTVDVYVGLSSLEDLEVTGGVIQTLPLDQSLNLSVNPVLTTAVPLVQYTWQCKALSAFSGRCPNSVSEFLTASNGTLSLPAGTLPLGGYLLRLTVSRERLTVQGVILNPEDSCELSVKVYVVESSQPTAEVRKIDGGARSEASVMKCSALVNGTAVVGAEYTWQQTSGGSSVDLTNQTLPGGTSLVIPKSSLPPYSRPQFLCTVTIPGHPNITAGTTLRGPLPPFQGGLSVSPISVNPPGFVFTLTAGGWVTDASDQTLTYVYSYRPIAATGKPLPLTASTLATTITALLPPGNIFLSVTVTGSDGNSVTFTAPEAVTVPGSSPATSMETITLPGVNVTDSQLVGQVVRQAVASGDLSQIFQTLGFVAGLSGSSITPNETAVWVGQLLESTRLLTSSGVPSSSALQQLACTLAGTSEVLLTKALAPGVAALFAVSDEGLRSVLDPGSTVYLTESTAKCFLRLWESFLAFPTPATFAGGNFTALITWPGLVGRGRLLVSPLPSTLGVGNVSMTSVNVLTSTLAQPSDFRASVSPWTVSVNVSDPGVPAGSHVSITTTSYAGPIPIFNDT